MSAIYSLNIDNLKIVLNSNELPILDGSSLDFYNLLKNCNFVTQEKNREILLIKKPIKIEDNNKYVSIEPIEDDFKIDFKIDFRHKAIGIQEASFSFKNDNYFKEIAPARTFGFLKDFDSLKEMGLARGANYNNVIVIGNDKVLNKGGLRFPNEFVRHKILDVIGDFTTLGKKIIGKYSSFAGSHNLNHLLIKKILADKGNYSVKS
jgi:UDP-3-O-[3-hydroxymyristoyl] N-acetylglucosamine deacetylase